MFVLVYASLLFLVLRFSVTLFNFLSNPKLGYYGKHYKDRVSVVFCGYEGHPDGTGMTQAELSRQLAYDNLQVVLPGRDQGKTALSACIDGDYVLVLEPGMVLGKGLVNSLIFRIKTFNLGMVAVLPDNLLQTFSHYLFLPMADFALINLFPLKLVSLTAQPALSLPVRGCMFYDAETYLACLESLSGGMPASQDAVRQIKQMGLGVEVLLANGFVRAETARPDITSERVIFSVFGGNALIALVYLLMTVAAPLVMMLNFGPEFLVLPFGLIFMARIMVSLMFRQHPVINLLLHPLQLGAMVLLVFRRLIFGKRIA
ncbi:hypothetical protein [Pedobacter sp. JY14-1]|uniref:hypothetical protein n=1 Tax=Pedobacter sp. JY14-1 TaxID=3034151 RepID=UPI0023E2C5AA|nr:hypothetical protein [Pedobacter sp. JY14-1]